MLHAHNRFVKLSFVQVTLHKSGSKSKTGSGIKIFHSVNCNLEFYNSDPNAGLNWIRLMRDHLYYNLLYVDGKILIL